jgi:ribonuclease VapC
VIVDTSAIVAIALCEPTAPAMLAAIQGAALVELSVASYVEVATVLTPRGVTPDQIDDLMASLDITIVPIDEAQGRAAIRARIAYGKGTGHRAQLNFGDTFTYALAKVRGASLLFVGEDFSHTDLVSALA